MGASQYSVRAAERVADILDALRDRPDGISLSALAARTGMPKSSVFRYAATLEARGYVRKDASDGSYSLGTALPAPASYLDVLAGRIRPDLERLRDRFGETVNLGVLDGARVLYVDIIESHQAMRLAAKRGDRDHLHCTALGKAILGSFTDAEVRRMLRMAGLPKRTSRTITRLDDLLGELAVTRERGYAVDDEENEEGARCVAVPLTGARAIAGISISAPAARLRGAHLARVAGVLADEVMRMSRRVAAAEASAQPGSPGRHHQPPA
jgi:IclR family acetate operon transcriptional repressor